MSPAIGRNLAEPTRGDSAGERSWMPLLPAEAGGAASHAGMLLAVTG